MAITRRQFIKRTGLATAGTLIGPSLFRSPWVRQAFADTIGDRYLIVLLLDGGNDGLNTVVPYDDIGGSNLRTAYQANRTASSSGGLRLSQSSLNATLIGTDPGTGTQLALHPGFTGLKNLYDQGKVAVIQGAGYPEYSLSHELSHYIWESGNPFSIPAYGSTGWAGRHLADGSSGYTGSDIPAVCIRDDIAREFYQTGTSVLAVRRLAQFGFPYDNPNGDDAEELAKQAAFTAMYNAAGASAQLTKQYAGNVGGATLNASESYPDARSLYIADRGGNTSPGSIADFGHQYNDLGSNFANDLREVARMIYANQYGLTCTIDPDPMVDHFCTSAKQIKARFFEVRNGGYDTHSDQGASDVNGSHYQLHKEVGDAIKVFYDDCDDMGIADKVCIVVWSEFSRRIEQNDNGTDHGSQGPMFVIGGTVNGGVYGKHPNINDESMSNPDGVDDNGNTVYVQGLQSTPYRSTDFRDVFGTILKHWVNMNSGIIVPNVFTLDTGSPSQYYWTGANFDIGFLP